MSFVLVDQPSDRSGFTAEALRVLAAQVERYRARLLGRVAAASDADRSAGTDEEWGVGQVALHLLAVERGISGIARRLARGEPAGPTGQPRPQAGSATRDGIATLAAKAKEHLDHTVATFPAEPNTSATARQPYYGELNCFGWLLAVPLHYEAHLTALERGERSAV